ncbi:MAG: hypothetical protein LBQ24_07125 [Candidatus Peribacteria bacterium]|nr:hypothetical protein [Candidatus Peribacteria bacterium]
MNTAAPVCGIFSTFAEDTTSVASIPVNAIEKVLSIPKLSVKLTFTSNLTGVLETTLLNPPNVMLVLLLIV